MFNLVSFESMLYEKEAESCLGEDQDGPCCHVENQSVTEALLKLIENLPEREKLIITLHYFEGLAMKRIARILNLSESRVSQIHSKVLMEMRIALES